MGILRSAHFPVLRGEQLLTLHIANDQVAVDYMAAKLSDTSTGTNRQEHHFNQQISRMEDKFKQR